MTQRIVTVLSMLLILSSQAMAADKGAVELKSVAEIEVTIKNDKGEKEVKRVEAAKTNVVPGDAVILFDGTGLDAWQRQDGTPAAWVVRDGYMEIAPGTGSIATRQAFGDVQLHIEFATPNPPAGEGQEPGNSGVYLMSTYEVQVLDSYGNDTYPDGQAAAIYGQFPPLVNASRPPGQWQSYDIVFHRPHFAADGTVRDSATLTVFHNGVLVHDRVALRGGTTHQREARYAAHPDRLPLMLQDHGERVRYRNVWVRELEKDGR